jgi:alpha-amylase/alpha-mannosidase (GH57 family)
VAAGQSVSVRYLAQLPDRAPVQDEVPAYWQFNRDGCSYWRAELLPLPPGTALDYRFVGDSHEGATSSLPRQVVVEALISLALIWHYHQPLYRDLAQPSPTGSYRLPWVRLHALRDYYAKTALLLDYPEVHVTINVTPVLLSQLDDYIDRGATDRALDLTQADFFALDREEKRELMATFFDADWHRQIMPHPRYRELFALRRSGQRLSARDIRDLQVWFNLCWFARAFREGEVHLCTGEVASVRRFVDKGEGFTRQDCREMVAEQYKILRAVVPLLRLLQERGQIEVSVTPFFHPILPLLLDSETAVLDRAGTRLPPRFTWPADATWQVRSALEDYRARFGRVAAGIWPAEGAVSPGAVTLLAEHGVQWLATDEGVLARSGRFGYRTDRPEVLAQPYRQAGSTGGPAVFFRAAELSNQIGFRLQHQADSGAAARELLTDLKRHFAGNSPDQASRVVTIVSDGENPWGSYPSEGVPFLQALYGLLADDLAIRTVTPCEYLSGNLTRGIRAHPVEELSAVHDLATGSWIDEPGSAPGVDLGTWIGEAEENRAWGLLAAARAALERVGKSPEEAPEAWRALLAAEGSDWFWWFGDDQDSGQDEVWDDLFRTHLRAVYVGAGLPPPMELNDHIVPHLAVFTFTGSLPSVQEGERLAVRTNCPGRLHWRLDDGEEQVVRLSPCISRVGPLRYQEILGPFPSGSHRLGFRFHCEHVGCDGLGACCRDDEVVIAIGRPPTGG